MKPKLKICGMKVPANILEVSTLQPDYLGFIFYKGSKRCAAGLSAEFVKALPAGIKKTGVFVDEDINTVAGLVTDYSLNAVQLHGAESAGYCEALKIVLGQGVELIKVFGIDESFEFDQLKAYVDIVDYFLFDTQTPDHGGSGKTFNWALLEKYTLEKPYFLSGGISPDSIIELNKIEDPRLYAIDINSRFELEPGLKDLDKLIDFKNRMLLR